MLTSLQLLSMSPETTMEGAGPQQIKKGNTTEHELVAKH